MANEIFSVLPRGSNESAVEELSHHNYRAGKIAPGLSRKDTVDSRRFKKEAYYQELTDRESSSDVSKYSVWPLKNNRITKDGDSNIYSHEILEEKVKKGRLDPELLAFINKIYESINTHPNYNAYRNAVAANIDVFIKNNAQKILKNYRDLIYKGKPVNRNEKGRFVSTKDGLDLIDESILKDIKDWVLEDGYRYLAEEDFVNKVGKLRDGVLSCKSIEDAKKKFDGYDGKWFVKNKVLIKIFSKEGIGIAPEWRQIINEISWKAFELRADKLKEPQRSLVDLANDKFAVMKGLDKIEVQAGLFGDRYTILINKKEIEISEADYLRLKNAIPDTYYVIATETGKLVAYNAVSKGDAQKASIYDYKMSHKEQEKFRDAFRLQNLHRVGPLYRPTGIMGETAPVMYEDILALGYSGFEKGNEVPGKRADRHSELQDNLDQLYDATRDISNALLIDPRTITNNTTVMVGSRGQKGSLATCEWWYDKESGSRISVINGTRFKGMGSYAHEFIHSLDHNLCDAILGKTKDFVGTTLLIDGNVRECFVNGDGLSKCYTQIDEQKFPALRDLMEYVNNENTEFYKESVKIDGEAGVYFSKPQEMLARAGAVYLYDKLKESGEKFSGKEWANDYFCGNCFGIAINGLGEFTNTYPNKEERKEFNRLFDAAFSELKSLEIVKGIDSPDYSSMQCWRTGEEMFMTGKIVEETIPLIGLNSKPDDIEINHKEIATDINSKLPRQVLDKADGHVTKIKDTTIIKKAIELAKTAKNSPRRYVSVKPLDFASSHANDGAKSKTRLFGER